MLALINLGRYLSGQKDLAVNQMALPSGVRIPPYPPVAEVAQLVEHSHGKGKATSSNLVLGS